MIKKLKLSNICKIQAGGTPMRKNKEYWENGNINWCKISDLKYKYVNDTEEKITQKGLDKSSAKLLKKGTILYTIFATIGEVSILNIDSATNQAIAGLEIINDMADKEYLYYFLKSKKEEMIKIGRGVAQNNINLTILKELEIDVPDIEKQKEIANKLNKIQKLIDIKEEQKCLYEVLIKSKFVEMFGNPFLVKDNEKIELKAVIISANNGMSRRGNNVDGNIVLRLVELQRNYIDYTNVNKIILKDNEKKKYVLLDGDVLFARVNGNPDNVGRCAYYKHINENVYYNDHIIRVKFDLDKVNPIYLCTLLNDEYGKNEFKNKIKTSAGQYTISQDGIEKVKILLPPIELQNKFAQIVKQIDKQKFEVQKNLEEMKNLQKNLMNKYFN